MKTILSVRGFMSALAILVSGGLTGCEADSSESAGTSSTQGATDATDAADGADGVDGSSGSFNSPDVSMSEDSSSWGFDGADSTDGSEGGDGQDGMDMIDGSSDGTDATDGSWGGWDATDAVDAADATDGSWGGSDGSDGGGDTGGSTGGTTGSGSTDGDPGGCVPACDGKQCGPDGCGGSCGWCSGNDSCHVGVCKTISGCIPACAGKMIGIEDGCGGVCSGSGMGIGLVPGGAQDAAYFRMLVMSGQVPDPDLLPIEGWLTEHGTALPPPETDRLVTLHGFAGLFYDPAEGAPTVAVQLGMNSGLAPEAIEAGQFNLAVVIDRSGSMASENKMDFVKDGLLAMLDVLDEGDLLSIVTYSSTAQVLLNPTAVTDANRTTIKNLIEGITPAGTTNILDGLLKGYNLVSKNVADKSRTPRVILLSDGMVNAGVTNLDSIAIQSKSFNDVGIGLTTIGLGTSLNFDLLHLLAVQGNGNFYFIESAEKMLEVFQEEISYLLTPVAENLRVWFTLPPGFAVEEIYGFEFEEANGQIQLLGPTPIQTIGGETPEPGGDDGSENPDVAVSTLFASKKNGLLMAKISAPNISALKALEGLSLAQVYYSYDLVDDGMTESFDKAIDIGSLDYDENSGFQYFSGATMQKNFCVLRSGLAMKEAVRLVAEQGDAGIDAAIKQLGFARTFCNGINVQNNDDQLTADVVLIEQLMENICQDCAEPF